MEQSDFLELNLLENNDYAGHWDVPLNDSFRVIDEEAEEIATELLDVPGTGYDGHLRGSLASLEQRLNVGLWPNGEIKFNSDDLTKSRYTRAQYTDSNYTPANIHSRIEIQEEKSFVDEALKKSMDTSGGNIAKAFLRHDRRTTVDASMNRRYSLSSGDLSDFYFPNGDISTNITYGGAGTILVNSLGLMQINGVIFNHTITLSVDATPIGTDRRYILYAGNIYSPTGYDCQLIRDSTVTGNLGSAVTGSSTFTSTSIGSFAGMGNNKWIPVPRQVLRVNDGVRTYDYSIKSVVGNSVDIFGKFEKDFTNCLWEIYDFTQPFFQLTSIVPIFSIDEDQGYMNSLLSEMGQGSMPIAFIHIDAAENFRVTAPYMGAGYTKHRLVTPDYNDTGFLGPGATDTKWSTTLTDVSVGKIKAISVITLESLDDGVSKRYYFNVNPTRYWIVGVMTAPLWMQAFKVGVRNLIDTGGTSFVDFGATNLCELTLYHPDYNDKLTSGGVLGTANHWTTPYGLYEDNFLTWSYQLEYLGILIELL
jgi:hypothetical protein